MHHHAAFSSNFVAVAIKMLRHLEARTVWEGNAWVRTWSTGLSRLLSSTMQLIAVESAKNIIVM
jgi:hypothetical protein